MTGIPICRPYVFLRCRECGEKTDHVMIDNEFNGKREIEEIYECQQCGEVKRIYELAISLLHGSMQSEISEKVEEERKKDVKEVTLSEVLAYQQLEKLENSSRKMQRGEADFSK